MLKTQLLNPHILSALAKAGHGSKVLISDGNYPHATRRGPNAQLVFLNLAPGKVGALDVLPVIAAAIPIEAAAVMTPPAGTPDPPIWRDFKAKLRQSGVTTLSKLDRDAFYLAASGPDVCLTIATGEQAIYANLLLTIGVVAEGTP